MAESPRGARKSCEESVAAKRDIFLFSLHMFLKETKGSGGLGVQGPLLAVPRHCQQWWYPDHLTVRYTISSDFPVIQ